MGSHTWTRSITVNISCHFPPQPPSLSISKHVPLRRRNLFHGFLRGWCRGRRRCRCRCVRGDLGVSHSISLFFWRHVIPEGSLRRLFSLFSRFGALPVDDVFGLPHFAPHEVTHGLHGFPARGWRSQRTIGRGWRTGHGRRRSSRFFIPRRSAATWLRGLRGAAQRARRR